MEGIIPDKKRVSDMMSEKKGEKGEKKHILREKKRKARGGAGATLVTLG